MLTHRELHGQMQAFAAGLQSLGLHAGDRVSLFSENSSRWLVADQGVMMLGAADAVSCLPSKCLLAMRKCTLPYLALFPAMPSAAHRACYCSCRAVATDVRACHRSVSVQTLRC